MVQNGTFSKLSATKLQLNRISYMELALESQKKPKQRLENIQKIMLMSILHIRTYVVCQKRYSGRKSVALHTHISNKKDENKYPKGTPITPAHHLPPANTQTQSPFFIPHALPRISLLESQVHTDQHIWELVPRGLK